MPPQSPPQAPQPAAAAAPQASAAPAAQPPATIGSLKKLKAAGIISLIAGVLGVGATVLLSVGVLLLGEEYEASAAAAGVSMVETVVTLLFGLVFNIGFIVCGVLLIAAKTMAQVITGVRAVFALIFTYFIYVAITALVDRELPPSTTYLVPSLVGALAVMQVRDLEKAGLTSRAEIEGQIWPGLLNMRKKK